VWISLSDFPKAASLWRSRPRSRDRRVVDGGLRGVRQLFGVGEPHSGAASIGLDDGARAAVGFMPGTVALKVNSRGLSATRSILERSSCLGQISITLRYDAYFSGLGGK
jgi:hypothetical protein